MKEERNRMYKSTALQQIQASIHLTDKKNNIVKTWKIALGEYTLRFRKLLKLLRGDF